jgi:hypothetical protein
MSIPHKSDRAEFDKDGFAAVKQDVAALCRDANRTDPVISSGREMVMAAATGGAIIEAVSTVSTTGSSGVNYHVVSVTRNGTAMQSSLPLDTQRKEVAAYQAVTLGSGPVTAGDIIRLSIATTGMPSALVASDWMLRITVAP